MARRQQLARTAVALGVLAVASSTPPTASAIDYDPIALECLVGAADVIALGRVDYDPTGAAYQLEVREAVAGERQAGRVPVKTSSWQGPPARPVPGEALLFLRRIPGQEELEVVGPSAEGWLPVEAESAAVRVTGVALPGEYGRGAAGPSASLLDLRGLLHALRDLDACVSWSRDPGRARVRASIVCEAPGLQALREQSQLARDLLEAAERASSGEGIRCLAAARPRVP